MDQNDSTQQSTSEQENRAPSADMSQTGSAAAPIPISANIPKGRVNIEVKANFDLDDARIFNLNGEGLTITMVTSN
jgi:hypothetical protein